MEPVRAFIAIELPDSIKAAVSRLQASMKPHEHASVKWANPQSVHLTLKFLGNIDPQLTPAIGKAMSEAATGISPLQLELGEPGAFPNPRAPRVVWVGLRGEIPSLSKLQGKVEDALEKLGFPREGRAFSPHLTLGRVRQGTGRMEQRLLGEAVSSAKIDAGVSFTADSLSLMRSTLTKSGAIYSRILATGLQIR
jgi:2'-5' RNA ligase